MAVKPRLRKSHLTKLTEFQKFQVLDHCHAELFKMLKEGNFQGDPNEWHPARVLTRLIYHPDSPLTLQFMCAKELAAYVSAPKAAQMRIEQQSNTQGDTNITIVVQGWASGERRADIEVEPVALPSPSSRTSEDPE